MMKFVDEIILHACSGKGGDGVVKWKSLPGKPRGGPGGGDGGDGGDVFIVGSRNSAILSKYRGDNKFVAGDGGSGGKSSLHGENGEDVFIELPVGSIVKDDFGNTFELTEVGEEIKILSGGAGGYGNEHFKSSRNVAPTESTDGKPGTCSDLHVELRLIADIGLIGFPNAGKSTLLNLLTNASAKTANYEFTTLDPNLGDMYGFIIADIPGLIEGAHFGKGLGDKFLRHVMRTKWLIHCISVERDDVLEAYNSIKSEMLSFSDELANKRELVLLTKTDLTNERDLQKKINDLQELNLEVMAVSTVDSESVKSLQDYLVKELRK